MSIRPKLSDKKIEKLFKDYDKGLEKIYKLKDLHEELADKYGVSVYTIRNYVLKRDD